MTSTDAVDGPALLTCTAHVAALPATNDPLVADLVRARLADVTVLDSTLLELFFRSGSAVSVATPAVLLTDDAP